MATSEKSTQRDYPTLTYSVPDFLVKVSLLPEEGLDLTMLPFENMVADYIRETGNHVAYRITPIFEGSNLVCSGVQMEAYSIEDEGAGICFNVYCYNVQPGITINYATGESSGPSSETTETPSTSTEQNDNNDNQASSGEMVWIPKSGKKYHSHSGCSNMSNPSQVTKEEAEDRGYTPCKKCW